MLEVKVPVFPESISEGTIAAWHKAEGDLVAEGEVIAEIETDKVMMEVPATISGAVNKINKQAGDTVHSQEAIALLSALSVQSNAEVSISKAVGIDTPKGTIAHSHESLIVKAPIFPESVTEGTVAAWHKAEGDLVAEGEVIAEIETDKVMMEVPATISGAVNKINKQAGDTVHSQEAIALLSALSVQSNAEVSISKAVGIDTPKGTIAHSHESLIVKAPIFPESVTEGTVAAWHKAEGGLVEEGEVIAEIETDKVMMEVPATVPGILAKRLKNEGDTVLSSEALAEITISNEKRNTNVASRENLLQNQGNKISQLSPAIRRAVKVNEVDVTTIKGTGKHGRITKQDVMSQQGKHKQHIETTNQISPLVDKLPQERYEKRVPMTRLRQTIAKRLVDVQQTSAILTTFNEVDMKPVMDLRGQYKDLFQKTHQTKLGFMSFFLKATTEALKRFPEVNASIDKTDVVYHSYFDIGVAVGSDRGLVVPVIRNTDQKSFANIEKEVVEKAVKARDGKLSLEEMQGGTFTITNGGTYGSMLSTPIINAPQSAILGMHNIVKRPVVIDDDIVVRPIMYLALSYDHRIIDGSVSVQFLKAIKEMIEAPARMLLEV